MKKFIKLLPLLFLVFAVGCDEDDTGRFKSDPTTGWIEFSTATSGQTISIITEEVILPVSIRVPNFQNGITVNYTLEAVQGDFSSIVSTGTSVSLAAAQAGPNPIGSPFIANIPLTFSGVADLSEIIIFDVVLTSTNINGVNVGLDEGSITRYRISTPCPIDTASFIGTYTVDEMFTGPPNGPNGLSDFFAESYQIELSLDPDDVTGTQMIVNNSVGFDTYINDGTILIFDTCNLTVSFSEAPLELALFSTLTIATSSYTETDIEIFANGAFGNFGNYEFTLTKQ